MNNEPTLRLLSEQELRTLIRMIINESWARDPGTGAPPLKTSGMVDHADPTGKSWDAGLDESDEDHEDNPRWEDHADPTGAEWDVGLDQDMDT